MTGFFETFQKILEKKIFEDEQKYRKRHLQF